jgi:hypothetical protein
VAIENESESEQSILGGTGFTGPEQVDYALAR